MIHLAYVQAKKRHKGDFARMSDDLQQIRKVLESYAANQKSINSRLEAAVQSKPGLEEVGGHWQSLARA